MKMENEIENEIEQLTQANDLNDFRAALAHVPLGELHGLSHNKRSRFPLIWAISARHKPLERVQLMLSAGARVDLMKPGADTVLHEMAAMKRKARVRLAILRLLVFKGAALEAVNAYGETPLSVAISRGSTEDVGYFVAVGSVVRIRDLRTAVYNPDKLRLLIDHLFDNPGMLAEAAGLGGWLRGVLADWRQNSSEAVNAGAKGDFHARAIEKLATSLKMIAELPGYRLADNNGRVSWAQEPAAFAAIENAAELEAYRTALNGVQIFTYGTDANGNIVMAGNHPIYWPIRAKAERLERLWLMLSAGASVKGRHGNGEALHIFADERRKDVEEQQKMAAMLVQAGAGIDAQRYDGHTPLAVAVAGGGFAEANALLAQGANPNVWFELDGRKGSRLTAPLIFAAASEPRIFELLLEHGASTDDHDSAGRPLSAYLVEKRDEYLRLAARNDQSGNLMRYFNRQHRALTKSLGILATV